MKRISTLLVLFAFSIAATIAHAQPPTRPHNRQNNGLRFDEVNPQMRARHLIHLRWSPNFEPVEAIIDQSLAPANLVFNDEESAQLQALRKVHVFEDRLQISTKTAPLLPDPSR
jgi:hypothetical protein